MEHKNLDTQKIALGLKIKKLRSERNLSQEEFAQSIQMDRSYLASVELGKRNVSFDNLVKLANGFGISLEELFKEI